MCTPNSTCRARRAVLAAGKHLVLEKPIATDLKSADDLVEVASQSGRHAMVALTYRGYPMVRRARAVVANGQLGDIRLIRGAYIQDWLSDATDYNWRVDPEVGGRSRAVADIGTHWFDTAEFVTGLRVEAVLADLATFIRTRSRSLDGGTSPSPPPKARSSRWTSTPRTRRPWCSASRVALAGRASSAEVSTGHEARSALNVDGSLASLTWDQAAEQLWLRERKGRGDSCRATPARSRPGSAFRGCRPATRKVGEKPSAT